MPHLNILTRRRFLSQSAKTAAAIALSTLVDIPFIMKRALAEGTIGLNGKKLLFIWLRFGNDSLNSIIPVRDDQYYVARNDIAIGKDSATDYSLLGAADFPIGDSASATYAYDKAIRLGNGFAALHPCLRFMVPVYNAGEMLLIHRVAYPRQSRSHFDSQNFWENGAPNNNLIKDGIFYRTILESGLANSSPLTGVSIQSALPMILRGSQAAMTNLSDPSRYDLLGIPNPAGDIKAANAINAANFFPKAAKNNRDLLGLQYENMSKTLKLFGEIDFDEDPTQTEKGNYYRDSDITNGDSVWCSGTPNSFDQNRGYYLFPTTANKNGGYKRPDSTLDTRKYVVPTTHHSFFKNLKAAALVLNKTDTIIAGTELGGFDTHKAQGGVVGTHANLQQVVGWSLYALKKYFTLYAEKAHWNNVIVVTLSEFGRTAVENSDNGTDHAEAGAMFVAGGAVKGYGRRSGSGVIGCSTSEAIPWKPGPRSTNLNDCGTMFAANGNVAAGYLRRSSDYRSILGEIIREHLGATQGQLNRIIPGYANAGECLMNGGVSSVDGVQIHGELGII